MFGGGIVWLMQLLSLTGDEIERFVMEIVVNSIAGTHPVLLLTVLTLVSKVPSLLFAPWIGTLPSRFNPRWIIIVSDFGAAFCSTAVLLVVLSTKNGAVTEESNPSHPPNVLLLITILITSSISSLCNVCQWTAFVTHMYSKSQEGNSGEKEREGKTAKLVESVPLLTQLIGPMIAGAIYDNLPLSYVFVISVGLCVTASLVLQFDFSADNGNRNTDVKISKRGMDEEKSKKPLRATDARNKKEVGTKTQVSSNAGCNKNGEVTSSSTPHQPLQHRGGSIPLEIGLAAIYRQLKELFRFNPAFETIFGLLFLTHVTSGVTQFTMIPMMLSISTPSILGLLSTASGIGAALGLGATFFLEGIRESATIEKVWRAIMVVQGLLLVVCGLHPTVTTLFIVAVAFMFTVMQSRILRRRLCDSCIDNGMKCHRLPIDKCKRNPLKEAWSFLKIKEKEEGEELEEEGEERRCSEEEHQRKALFLQINSRVTALQTSLLHLSIPLGALFAGLASSFVFEEDVSKVMIVMGVFNGIIPIVSPALFAGKDNKSRKSK
eukprot:m.89111 g.89111  ORF g.89111 m.89111 type:complete len:548 (-) comp8825_c0_seq1:38-1681(-)